MSSHSLQDPLLIKTKDGIETKLPEELKEPTNRIVIAGMKLLYSPQTHPTVVKLYEKLKQSNFQPDQIANGMVNLLGLLMKASKGNMPVEGAYPAGAILLCYVLDDLEQMYQLTPTMQTIQTILKSMTPKFMHAFGVKKPGDTTPNAQPGGLAQQPAGPPQAPPQPMPPAPAPQGAM